MTPTGAPAQFVYSTFSAQPVWRVLVPVTGTFGPDASALSAPEGPIFLETAIQIGTEPDLSRPLSRAADFEDGRYLVSTGRAPNWMTPDHQPDTSRWYSTDLAAMRDALGLSQAGTPLLLEPETIAFIDTAEPGRAPVMRPNPFADPAAAGDLPPARHMGYALTWWGLGLGLIAIYLAFHVSRGRLTFRKAASK